MDCWIDRLFWVVFDEVAGAGEHQVESLLHFHPDVEVRERSVDQNGVTGVIATRNRTSLQVVPWGATTTTLVRGLEDPIQGWYAPEFGKAFPDQVWQLGKHDTLPLHMGYVLWPNDEPIEVVAAANKECGHIIVKTAVTTYRITCTYHAIDMEKD